MAHDGQPNRFRHISTVIFHDKRHYTRAVFNDYAYKLHPVNYFTSIFKVGLGNTTNATKSSFGGVGTVSDTISYGANIYRD